MADEKDKEIQHLRREVDRLNRAALDIDTAYKAGWVAGIQAVMTQGDALIKVFNESADTSYKTGWIGGIHALMTEGKALSDKMEQAESEEDTCSTKP